MSESTNTKQKDILTTQENVENNHNKNSNLVEIEKINGTPFHLVKKTYEDNSSIHFLVMGDYMITEPTELKIDTLDKLESEKWLIIMHVCIITHKKTIENPIIREMDEPNEIQTTDEKWVSPRERENKTRQKYKLTGNPTPRANLEEE